MDRNTAVVVATLVLAAAVPTGALAAVDAPEPTAEATVDPGDDAGSNATNQSLVDYFHSDKNPFEIATVLLGLTNPPNETYNGTVRWIRYGGRCGGANVNGTEVPPIQYDAAALVLDTGDRYYTIEGTPLGEKGLTGGDRVTVTGHLETADDQECPPSPTDQVLIVEQYTVHGND